MPEVIGAGAANAACLDLVMAPVCRLRAARRSAFCVLAKSSMSRTTSMSLSPLPLQPRTGLAEGVKLAGRAFSGITPAVASTSRSPYRRITTHNAWTFSVYLPIPPSPCHCHTALCRSIYHFLSLFSNQSVVPVDSAWEV